MDTLISELLAPSPQRFAENEGDELPGVEHWLKDGLTGLGDEDIVGSLVDFTGNEFFNDSPPGNENSDNVQEHVPQQSGSSNPTSSADGPTSSGAVCGGNSAGAFNRMGGFRSFSTNDLQLLLEEPLSLFPPMTGLSAPHGSHMGMAGGAKAKSRPVLESVPEGSPSQGGPLPMPASLPIPAGGYSSGAGSPALSGSPGALPYLSSSMPEPVAAAAYQPPAAAPSPEAASPAQGPQGPTPGDMGPQQAAEAAAASAPAGVPTAAASAAASGVASGGGSSGGLRTVPSTGTLSALMTTSLQIQREGSDESPQQLPRPAQQPQPQPIQLQPQHSPFLSHSGAQQQVIGGTDAVHAQQQQQQLHAYPQQLQFQPVVPHYQQQQQQPPQQQQQQQLVGPGMSAAGVSVAQVPAAVGPLDPAAAAVAAAAAAAGVYPMALPGHVHPGGLAGFTAQACLYGVPAQLTTAASMPTGAYTIGLQLPVPARVLAGQPSAPSAKQQVSGSTADESASGDAGAVAQAGAAARAAESGAAPAGSGGPRLRKSQSALELGAWRSVAASQDADGFEAPGTVTVSQKMIGRLTPEERLQRILRYRNKRNQRNFNREIKYQCRKTLADSRPRVGGRFARNDDPNSVMPHQTKKAMRMKGGSSQSAAAAVAPTPVKREPSAGGDAPTGFQMPAAATDSKEALLRQLSAGLLQQQQLQHQQQQQQQQQQQTSVAASTAAVVGAPNLQRVSSSSRAVGPASSSTTTTNSTNSSDALAAVTSGTTTAAAAAAATASALGAAAAAAAAFPQQPFPGHHLHPPQPQSLSGAFLHDVNRAAAAAAAAAPVPPPHPGMLTTPGGLPYSYAMPALQVPYTTQGGVLPPTIVLPHVAMVAQPGALPAGMDPSQLQHHYAIVNAAAQAAARGVYAHLGITPDSHAAAAAAAAAAVMPLHSQGIPVTVPGAAACFAGGYSFPSGVPAVAVAAPTVPGAAAAAVGGAGVAAADVPPRISTPFIDELLTHMDAEIPGLAPAVLPAAATATSAMAVDG